VLSCTNWSALKEDLDNIQEDIISLKVNTDPFGGYDEALLHAIFRDVVRPFKHHFVVDLSQNPQQYVNKHHQRNVRKGLNSVEVALCDNPHDYLDDWCRLYDNLIERHQITGVQAFSRTSFSSQLKVPGIRAFRAEVDGKIVGLTLWYVQGNIAFYHLGAYDTTGYESRASYAIFWTAIEYFANAGLEWLNLGAGAGSTGDSNDGLSRYKRGWSTGIRTAYLCGRIFDHDVYSEITKPITLDVGEFFPAYRFIIER